MKNIKIEDITHERLKKYCTERGYKLNDKADTLISEYLDLLLLQEKNKYVWLEKDKEKIL